MYNGKDYELKPEESESIRKLFVSMRDEYPWSESRPDVPDSRVIAKANEEYHGFQRHAGQYAAAAMYKEAAQHFNEAAALREDIIKTHPQLDEPGHKKAADMCRRFANYYAALDQWQQNKPIDFKKAPKPETYGLSKNVIDKLENEGQKQLDVAMPAASSLAPPVSQVTNPYSTFGGSGSRQAPPYAGNPSGPQFGKKL